MAGEDAFRCAVEAHRAATDEHGYEAVWSLLEPLARATPAVAVQMALAGLRSADAAERSVATDLLGLVAGLHRAFRAQVVRSLLRQSNTERHEDVQWSLAMASAHSDDARTFPVLARLMGSSDADVRYQVAQAVGAVADATTKDTAVRLLRLLAADAEEGVRAKAMETLLILNRPPE
jgi:HEAT repeat protein